MYSAVAGILGVSVICGMTACKDSTRRASPPSTTSVTEPAAPVAVKEPAPEPGSWYHAKLVFKDTGELPFFLHLPPQGERGTGYIVNGDEKVDVNVEWRDDDVTIVAPWAYTTIIEAERRDTGVLAGTWTRDTPLWGAVVRDFEARPIDAPDPRERFPDAGDAGKVSVSGTWKFQFAEHKDGKGVFEQGADGVVRGYIKPGQLGDIRFLAGNFGNGKLALSQFNGNAANLVLATVSADGKSMSGVMSMQNVWNEKFTAEKTEPFELANKVRLKEGKQSITLRGLDKYKGKPTLAIIFATWCSSCNDAYPYLKQIYSTYHPKGLEVLGVTYDLSDDEKVNLAELDRFRARYDVPWELLQVPSTTETWAKAMPPELEGWDGLPIMAMVRPDGTVQTVFGGWLGPATGADGERLRTWFEESIRTLLAE